MRRAAELLAWGATVEAAARSVGVRADTVRRWKRRPEFQQYLAEADERAETEMRSEIRRVFRESYRRFLDAYLACLDEPDPDVRFKAVRDFLDRVGLIARQEHQVTGGLHYTYEVVLRPVTREELEAEGRLPLRSGEGQGE